MARRGNAGAGEPLLPSSGKRRQPDALLRCVSHPDDELQWFRSCLRWMCMDQSGVLRAAFSWALFILLAVAVPASAHIFLTFRPQRQPPSAVVQASLSAASAASFLCLSAVSRRIGLRRFLFLDKLRSKSDRVRHGYTARLSRSFRLLASLVAPCFVAEAAYKVWWYAASADHVPFIANPAASDVVCCALELASWLYRSATYLLTCVLFQLICYLQGLRLEDFAASLLVDVEEGRADVERVLREHLDIRKQLKIISHRFRGFIVACLLLVTASQFASVLLTTRRDSVDDLLTTGELAVCSIVLVAGLVIILSSAAKITHRAQSLTGHTAKWHACSTIEPADDAVTDEHPELASNPSPMPEDADSDSEASYETGDEDLLENTKIVHPSANVISFQKRQALVTYLENNRAGITIFGFTLDRAYLHTIFMLEWTLFLWLLGKTIGFS